MADDINGNYTLKSNKYEGDDIFQQQADSGAVASSNHIDSLMVDIKNAINKRFNITGSKAMSGPLNLNNNAINNVKLGRDWDLNGYKLKNYGNLENEPYGQICEKMDAIEINPCIGDVNNIAANSSSYNKRYGMMQVIGDIMFFTGILKISNTASPQTLGSGTYINLSNGMQLPPEVIYTETVNEYFYPATVIEISPTEGRKIFNARIIKSTTGNKTLIELLDANFNSISNYVLNGQTIQFSGWYKIAKDSFVVPETVPSASTGGSGTIPDATTFNNDVVINGNLTTNGDNTYEGISTFNDTVELAGGANIGGDLTPDPGILIDGRDLSVDGTKLDTIDPAFKGMSMTSNQAQTAALANTAYPVTVNNIHVDGGLTHTALPASEFTVVSAGIYELSYMPWMKGSAGNLMEFFWQKDTGAGFVTIQESVTQSENHGVIEQRKSCRVVTSLSAGDKIRAMWATGSTGMSIDVYASIAGNTVPTVQMYIMRVGNS